MRWIFRLASIFVLLAIVAVSLIALVPAERIAAFAAREMSLRTGREVLLSGKIRPVFYPVLGIRADGLRVGNASWSAHATMLNADRLYIGVEPGPLLGGELRIRELRLDGVELFLERASDGRANWRFGGLGAGESATTGDAGLPQAVSLIRGAIRNASVSFADHGSGARSFVDNVNVDLSVPDLGGKAVFSASGRLNGTDLSLKGDIARFNTFLDGGISGVSLKASGDFGSASADGRAGVAQSVAELELSVDARDAAAAAALAGFDPGAVGLPFGTASISGRMTLTPKGVFLRNAALGLDENRLSGAVDLTFGDRMKVMAKISARDLDFRGGDGGANSADAPSQTGQVGWSTAPIDLAFLRAVDADIAFEASSAVLGPLHLGQSKVRLKLDQGRLVALLDPVHAYEGTVSGQFVVNARSGLSMGGDLQVHAVQLQPLLTDLARADRLIAAADGRLKFLTSGASTDRLMRNLSGDGELSVGSGEIDGFDLVGMLRNLDGTYRGGGRRTVFSSIRGSFVITSGVLENKDLAFVNPVIKASGEGEVDLGTQTVTYRITPAAFAGDDGNGGVSVPVLITGPWSKLSFQPDLQGMFDAELQVQRKKAEENLQREVEKAKKEAEQKLREQLDQAVREGADKILGDVLKKLEGGN